MTSHPAAPTKPYKPGIVAYVFIYLIILAVIVRTLAVPELRPVLTRYLVLEVVYLILYSLVLWGPRLRDWMLHLYLILQCCLVFWMLSLFPEFDFIILLFALLTFQVTLYFNGRMRWVWIATLVFLTGGSLVYFLGLLEGLAKSLTTMAGEIVLSGYIIASQDIALSQRKSQELLGELEQTNRQLRDYASQVGELASMQERNRLARELHDTVSQLIFSISLTIRSAQLLLDRQPERLAELLERLQQMTADALSQLRSFITQLHPPQNS